jgi:uncharacterized protein YndB with AHSA1/START domain
MATVKTQIEYPVKCKPALLFTYLTDPVFLSQWFADKVEKHGETWTFNWNGELVKGEMVDRKINASVTFELDFHGPEEFIQMQIVVDAITEEIELLITDFCEEGEEEDLKLLWNTSIERLHRAVGA